MCVTRQNNNTETNLSESLRNAGKKNIKTGVGGVEREIGRNKISFKTDLKELDGNGACQQRGFDDEQPCQTTDLVLSLSLSAPQREVAPHEIRLDPQLETLSIYFYMLFFFSVVGAMAPFLYIHLLHRDPPTSTGFFYLKYKKKFDLKHEKSVRLLFFFSYLGTVCATAYHFAHISTHHKTWGKVV